MAKKLTVKELEAARKAINKDEEDEKKAKAKAAKTAAPVYTYKEAGSKVSPPAVGNVVTPIGIAAPGANKNIVPIPTATPEKNGYTLLSAGMPQRADIGLLHPDLVRKYLQQGMAYAKQGQQSRMDIYNSLTGFDIGDYAKGDVNSLDYDISREMSKRNQYFMDQHRQQGTFDSPEFLVAGKITGPSTDYLTKQNDAVKVALEESKAKDATAAANKEQNADQEVAWQNLYKAKQEEKDFFDEWYNLLLADHLLNNSGQIWDFEVADARYGEDVMDDVTYEAELKRLREQMQGVDWATKTGYNTADYESQTPALQAKYDLISGELTRRKRIEELEAMADSSPNYAEWSVYQEPDVALDPMWKDGGAHALVAGLKAREERWGNKQNFINNWHKYQLTGGYEGVDNTLPGKIADSLQGIIGFIGGDETSGEISTTIGSYIAAGLQYMSDKQIAKYNVLYEMGPEYAEEYLELIGPELLKQKADVEAEYYATRAQNLGTSIWDNLVGFVKKPWGTFNTMLGALSGETDPNAQIYGPARQLNVTREATGEALAENSPFDVFGVPVTKAGYYILTSIGDMLVANKIGTFAGSLTGKADAAKKVMNFVTSSGAGADTYLSDLQNVQDPMYAVFHGIAIGSIEALSESGFIDSLFSPEGKFIARVAKSAGAEGLGGAVSEGGGMAVDLFMSYLTGQKNEIEKTYAYYDATLGKDKAALATLQHYANSFALAASSEALIGGGTSAVVNTGDYLDTRSYGKDIVNNGDADTILKIAQGMAEDSESKHIADAITGKQEKGKKPSFYQFGQLTKAIVKDLGEERAAIANRVQDEAIAGRLQELGDDAETAKKNAPIIRKVYRGEKLTMDERAAVRWNDRADKVTKELIRENNYTGDQPVPIKWVKGMKETQASESADVIGKQLQVQVATVTPIGKAANRAEEAAKKRVPKRDGKPKLATDSHVTFRGADGSAKVSGDIMRFEESDEGMQVVVQTGKGKEGEQKVKLDDWISADGDGVATILSYIGDEQLPHSVTAEEANTLMQVYKHSGGNAKAVIQAFDVNYLAGYSGADQVGSVLDPALPKIAYENGKRDAEKDEAQRKQRASEYKALENPVAGWIGKVDGREQVKGLGDEAALKEALQAMPESQRTAAEIMIETGKAVGLNVVLYDSDGKGAANDIQNGMFDAVTHTVYFDVSAWAGNEKRVQALKKEGTLGYAMLRVGGHELTHYLEVAAPEAYAKYSKAVKDALKAKGVDFAVQMRERIDKANAQGRKLTMAGAAAEVIADASEYMLQDSKLFNNLDTDTKGKIRAFLQNFAQKVKEIFQHLTGGHKESAALREMKNGVYHYLEGLQDLWDAGFVEILAKGTTDQSGDATEMVEGVQFSDREDQTETEAFKRWFGDSVVVNRDGTPKVMYHGSKENFTVFDKSILKDKLGFFFTEDKQEAQDYGTARSFYLSIKNPYDIWDGLENYGKTSEEKVKGLKDAGYDGIISYSHGTTWYIAFEPTQIKSATGNVGTFDPENPDIRYSDRDLPDGVTIREYLGAMKPTSSMTETEKLLLKRYQDQLRTLAEKEKLVSEQDEIIRNTPAGDELTKAKNRRKIYRDQADRAARAIANAEKDEGFARLMVTSRQVMNDYLTGAGGNVADASDALDSEVRALTDKLKKLEADITRSSDGQRAAFARGLFNPDELKAAAKILKSNYGSRMSVENIANRLALAYGELYAEEGAEGAKRFSEAARDLAVDLLKGNKFRYRSDILPTLQEKIGTISLSETDIQEIKHRGYTLREYKNMLSPYIKVTEGGSSISSYASNAQYYDDGTLAAILGDDTEGNLAMRLYDVISHEKAKEAEASYGGMNEGQLVGMAMADIASANLPMSTNDSTVEYLRKELLKYAGQNANIVHAIEEAISNAKQATRRASKLWHEAVKVSETAKQAVKYYRKLDEHRRVAELADQKRILTEQLKGDAAKTLKEMRARYQEQIDNIRLRRDINIEIGKKTRHIKRVVKALNDRIVHEEDYKNVKEPLKPAVHTLVRTFVDGFGNLVFDQKSAERLRGVYDAIANDDAAPDFYSDDVANWLTDLASMKELDALIRAEGSSSLSAAEEKLIMYSRVADIADHIYKMVTDADEIFINGKRASIAVVSGEVGDTLVAKPDKPLLVGKARDAARIADDLLRTGNMTPQYFFDHLKNSGLTKLFDGLMDGQQQYAQAIREGQEAVAAAKDKYNFYSWQNMKEGVEFRTEQGHRIALTVPQMMWVYATAKREATNTLMDTHHLDQGGFRYESNALPREKGKMTAIPGSDKLHKLSAKDVAKITDTLTAEQKACADELVGYLSEDCAEMGNEASMKLFGIKKYNEEYYFPFKTAGDQRYQRSDAGSTSTTNDARVKHASFTHSLRRGANTPLVMGDFFDVIADHINMMATYSSFVVPIESMNRVLNTKVNEDADGNGNDVTIRSLVGTKYGEPAQKYIADLMKDLNGGPQTDNRGGISALFRAFKRGAVMGSLSVTLQQPTSVARAMAYVNPKYFLHLTGEGNKKTWERMMRYSGTTVIKDMGKFDVGTGKMANDWIANSDLQNYNVWKRGKFLLHTEGWNAVKNNYVDFLTALPGVMDRVTWTHIWKAIEAEQADLNPGMDRNSDEFLTAVGKRFDDVINHTQVYDSILAKSQNMRSKNPLTQMSTAFMSEPTLNINMLYDAVRGEHDAPQRAAIITSVIASSILAAAMASLISAWNKDDDERKWGEKYLTEFANRAIESVNPLTMIPYIADLWSMINGYDIERTDLSVVKDILDYGSKFFSNVHDPEKANGWRDYENFFGTIANLLGVPAKNISRDIRRVRNLVMTDKSAASGSSLRYSLLETITPFGLYASTNTSYYERLLAATMDGDKQEQYDLKDYLMATKGVKEDTVRNGVVNAYKKEYQRGGITKKEAADFLYNNDLVKGTTADKKRQAAFKKVDEWDEGSENYSVYNTIFDAVKNGNSAGITNGIKELTNNGYVESDVVSGVRTMIRESYMEGTMSQSQVKTAYKSHFAPKNFDVNDQNDWYWLFKELDWGKKNGNSTDGYYNYIFLKDGFTKYNESTIRSAWNELTSHGYEDDDVKSYVRTYILKPMVQEGKITTSRATDLLNRWASYKKNSDNIDKPKEWLNSK